MSAPNRTLGDELSRAASVFPGRPAVVAGGRVVSYRRLQDQARAWAWRLRELGVAPGGRVTLYLDRSPQAVGVIHGILAAGACYIPVDTQMPWPRLRQILEDSRSRVLLARTEVLARHARDIPSFVTPWPVSGRGEPRVDSRFRRSAVSSDDPAYILYTSGSTGKPKGVELTHRNALHFVDWAQRRFRIRPSDRVANLAPFQFDLSVFDVFNSCRAGAALYPIAYPDSLFPSRIAEFLAAKSITVFYTVPSVLSALNELLHLRPGEFPRLRLVLFAGEVMPPRVLAAWMRLAPRARFHNLYGPTETNVCLHYAVPRRWGSAALPLGRPLPGIKAAIVGSKSELCVSGPSVMKGYVDDPKATRRAFVRRGGDVFYRTGDIVSRGKGGLYHFLGRVDAQVKIRGFRVELGDVESAIRDCPGVAEAAVLAVKRENGLGLAAYVRPSRGTALRENDVLKSLEKKLPPYMLPWRVEILGTLPRLVNGKLDRRSLGSPRGEEAVRAAIRELWSAKFKRRGPPRDDESFWESGALDSLELLQLVHHLEEIFTIRIPERDVQPRIFHSIETVSRYIARKTHVR